MKRLLAIVLIVSVIALIAAGGSMGIFTRAARIEVVRPRRTAIRESFREPSRTRLQDTWSISMQIAGRIGRIDLEPGDRVKKGEELVEFDRLPLEQAARQAEANISQLHARLAVQDDHRLEEAQLLEADAMAESARESVNAAEARIEESQVRVERADKELARTAPLADAGTVSPSVLDDARADADTARFILSGNRSNLASQRARLSALTFETLSIRESIARKKLEREEILAQIARAESELESAEHDLTLARVVSPIHGVVLERYERGERPLERGARLLLLGNPAEIELLADVLTEDALRLKIGGAVEMESLASGLKLLGAVKRIEPQGFTKLSSLGVEQQRVNVIVAIEEPPAEVGVGYRLHARFFTGAEDKALVVPRFSVLQSPDRTFYVFVVEEGVLRRRTVRLGLRSDLTLEILDGIDETSLVVAAPDPTMEEGAAAQAIEGAR